ncbi:DUF6153 family protein [Actinomadura opuntiae]|uniref:DUF6153 family protein n=1 Tax=Actinomadura sp. OS1-43 TaxID=604315 RepID=UPI00255A7719|nr:DUF6153 family protein [Actinomadura sp. OS1-43]MDL4815045.1 DUF6153 family protein [Actinomadura sp. OS1-43]
MVRRRVRRLVPSRRFRPGRLFLLSFALLLLLGVLAMHGLQASPNPSQMTGLPLTSAATVHDAAPSHSMAPHHPPGTNQPDDHHQDHPGGQVCLAFLAMLLLLGLVSVLFRRSAPAVAALAFALARMHVLPVGRPPPRPSLHYLSVLRL